jgi:hypothetical protein
VNADGARPTAFFDNSRLHDLTNCLYPLWLLIECNRRNQTNWIRLLGAYCETSGTPFGGPIQPDFGMGAGCSKTGIGLAVTGLNTDNEGVMIFRVIYKKL